MIRSKFKNTNDASDFAKSLARNGITHNLKRDGSSWVVYHETNSIENPNLDSSVELQELRTTLLRKNSKIDDLTEQLSMKIEQADIFEKKLESENASLQDQINTLHDNFEKEMVVHLENKIASLDEMKRDLSDQINQAENKNKKIEEKLHRLSLLEKVYSKHFGEAEVKIIKETVNTTVICQKCGGDGGVRNGCYKCDGTGWTTAPEIKSKEVVVIK